MQSARAPIDISNIPELVRLTEEVEVTQESRELKWNDKTVAIIMPVTSTGKTEADYEAFWETAGSLKGLIDVEKLKEDICESRKLITRPAFKL